MMARLKVNIPQERVGPLVGRDGSVKERIEAALSVNLIINSEGSVEIEPKEGCDPAKLLKAKDLVLAIGRGFSPERGEALLKEDCVLDIIDLRELFGKSESDINRVKGRVIGREGKTRTLIEDLTRCKVSVYGHTIGLIGDYESVSIARGAVELLLKGKQHSTVYGFLRAKRREVKRRETVQLWEKPS